MQMGGQAMNSSSESKRMDATKSRKYSHDQMHNLRENLSAWVFLLPFLLFYAFFTLYPIFKGLFLSFTSGSFGIESKFVGVANYIRMFQDAKFWEALWNTLGFVIVSSPVIALFGLLMALIVNVGLKGTTVLRSIFFMPYMLAISVMVSIWKFILQPYTGLLNSVLHQLGVEQEIFWLAETNLAWTSILLATLWWTVGFNMILILAGLQEIPGELYEASNIDGANGWQAFWFITLPSLRKVLVLIMTLQSIASFKLFGQPWLLTGGGPGTSTRPLVQYIYETGFKQWDTGYSSSLSYVLFAVIIIFSVLQNKLLSPRSRTAKK